MDRAEFKAIMDPLVIALRADFDLPTWTVYFRALEDIPTVLLAAAVEALVRETREYFPKPAEIRARAEARRQVLLEAHPYERCAECHFIGTVRIGNTIPPKYKRCACWDRYQARLAAIGIGAEPLALPAGRSSEMSHVSE